MKVEYEFTYTATLKAPVAVGPGPYGLRMFYEISGATAQGSRIRGRLLAVAAAGSWWAPMDGGVSTFAAKSRPMTGP